VVGGVCWWWGWWVVLVRAGLLAYRLGGCPALHRCGLVPAWLLVGAGWSGLVGRVWGGGGVWGACFGVWCRVGLVCWLLFEICIVDASIFVFVVWSSFLGHTVDALASGADEGRGRLR
jgi:hypothetical protein